MKTKLIIITTICLLDGLGIARAQIESTCPVTFGADGQLTLNDVDLMGDSFHVASALSASDCLLDIPTATDLEIAGGTIQIGVDTLGNLIFSGGKADLQKNLYLKGDIKGETDRSTFTLSAAMISKCLALPAMHTVETGLGLTLTANTGHKAVVISRTHIPTSRRDRESIARRYGFSAPVSIATADINCLPSQVAPMQNPQLYYRHQTKQSWDQVYESGLVAGGNHVTGVNFSNAVGLTVFDADEIYCPAYFTPNGDGINDLYEIENSYKYPDSRLVIMTRRGKVVYDRSPYRNDFDGANLKADTYYFVFYKSPDDAKPQKWAVDIYR